MIKAKYVFSRHYEAIKLGMLCGLLVSNIFLISKVVDNTNKQRETTDFIKQQINEDNDARVRARAENKESDQDFRVFICSLIRDLLVAGNSETRVESLDSCASNIPTPSSSSSTTQSSSASQPIQPTASTTPLVARQNPTTSTPPDADTGVTLLDVIKEVPNVPKNIIPVLGGLL